MSNSKKLAKTSAVVTLVMIVAHFLSFVKEAVIAKYFGLSYTVDAYTIAIQIPVLLFSFVSVAIQSVVVPIYSDIYFNEGAQKAKAYIDHLLTILIFISLFIVTLGEIFAGQLIYVFAPGFNDITHDLAVQLLHISLPSIILSIIGQVIIAVLNVHKSFIWPSMAVFFMNVTMIITILLLHSQVGIVSACVGQLIGDTLRCIFIISIAKKYYNYTVSLNLKDAHVIKTLKLSIPVFLSISVAELNAIVNRIVASMLFVGSISAITYSNKINTVLMQFFVSAIATVVYPLYAESTAKGNIEQLNNRVNLTMAAYALFVVPLMCGIWIFKTELVEIAFARGAFDNDAVTLTQSLLGCYSIGMLFMSLRSTVTNVFYSLKDTKTPAINASVGAILNIILNITLPYFWGIQGIAIATSITAIYITSSLLILLTKKYDGINLTYFFKNLKRIVIASAIMLFITYFIRINMHLTSFVTIILGAIAGIICYALALLVMRVPIALKLYNVIKK
jgi:putative peptidoglycan lipid II flippase